MNISAPTMFLLNPSTAKNRYTPATVVISLFTCIPSFLLMMVQNSQTVIPVMIVNRSPNEVGLHKMPPTRTITNTIPVMARTIRFVFTFLYCYSVLSLDSFGSEDLSASLSVFPPFSEALESSL